MAVSVDDRPPTRQRRYVLPLVIGAVVVTVASFVLTRAFEPTHYVDRLTIANPTAFNVDIDLADGDGTVGLGTVAAQRTEAFHEVVDQGPTWVLRFSSAGVAAGELQLTRGALERSGWRVRVPVDVDARLRAARLSPSA